MVLIVAFKCFFNIIGKIHHSLMTEEKGLSYNLICNIETLKKKGIYLK